MVRAKSLSWDAWIQRHSILTARPRSIQFAECPSTDVPACWQTTTLQWLMWTTARASLLGAQTQSDPTSIPRQQSTMGYATRSFSDAPMMQRRITRRSTTHSTDRAHMLAAWTPPAQTITHAPHSTMEHAPHPDATSMTSLASAGGWHQVAWTQWHQTTLRTHPRTRQVCASISSSAAQTRWLSIICLPPSKILGRAYIQSTVVPSTAL